MAACREAFGADHRLLALAGDLADAARGDEIAGALAGWGREPPAGLTFDERLANAHLDVPPGGPSSRSAWTPQVTVGDLHEVVAALDTHDAVLGPAGDGGWWVLGLWTRAAPRPCAVCRCRRPRRTPTPAPRTPAPGWASDDPPLRDVDTATDADVVAGAARWRVRPPGARCAHDRPGAGPRPLGPRHRPAMTRRCWTSASAPPSTSAAGRDGWRPASRPGDTWCSASTSSGERVGDRRAPGRDGAAPRRVRHAPGEGRWSIWFLADGNVGIGGDPATALLRRVRELLAGRPGRRRGAPCRAPARARLGRRCAPAMTTRRRRSAGPVVGVDDIDALAVTAAGLLVGDVAVSANAGCAVPGGGVRIPDEADFRSRLRSAAVTAPAWVSLAGICFGVCFLTGLVSHYAQNAAHPVLFPDQPGLGLPGDVGPPSSALTAVPAAAR